jgi:TRAP-type C4-dicarboxylate transport system substrate-binding protein
VRRIKDLQGRKVWGPLGDEFSNVVLATVGVSPVPLSMADVLTALQTGLVDTVAISPVGAIALQWHTRVRYMTDVPLIYTYGTLVMAPGAFAGLEPGDREILRSVLGGMLRDIDARNRQEETQARAALRDQGIEILAPAPEEVPRFREIADEALVRLRAEGVFSAAMLRTLQGHLEDFRARGE